MNSSAKWVLVALAAAACSREQPPEPAPDVEERRLVEAIRLAEPESSRVRISHYARSEDGRLFCGLALVDGRVANFALRWEDADLRGPPSTTQLTRSIDKAADRQAARDAFLPTLVGIMETCRAAEVSLRPPPSG